MKELAVIKKCAVSVVLAVDELVIFSQNAIYY